MTIFLMILWIMALVAAGLGFVVAVGGEEMLGLALAVCPFLGVRAIAAMWDTVKKEESDA